LIQRTRSLAALEVAKRHKEVDFETPAAVHVHVPIPDLGRFDQFLSSPADPRPVSVFFT
jgi:hypothetical protein